MRIAIIGAGAAGLAAAYDLARAGHDVTVYEAGAEVGGLAAGFKAEHWDWTLEKFYHHWFYNDEDVLGLLEEIGCRDKVVFPSPTTSYYHEQGNFALDRPVFKSGLLSRIANVLSIPYLPLFARLRFGLIGAILAVIPDGTFLEKHTADRWMLRMSGQKAHNLIWRPMLIGKFGPLYDQVNMAWMWARINKRTAQLGSYEGGFQAALEDMADAARAQGAQIRLNCPVERIDRQAEDTLTITADSAALVYDKVLCTTGPGLLLKLMPDLPADYARQLGNLKGLGALALILALDRRLMQDGTYWLNLPANDPDWEKNPFPYLALVEHTNYLSREHYGGDHLIYMGDYLPADHEHMNIDPEALLERFLPSLERVNPEFSREWIEDWWLFRVPYAQPVPLVNHSQNIPDIRTPVAGLYLASMAQVYPWDRGTNYAVEIGRRTARLILDDA